MDYIVKAYKDWKFHLQFQEIVPDMDDEFVFNEKQSICESARTLKKYGSTCCNHSLRNNETLIRHEIRKTDTLQGIALKYGCTTEQIRRANRLFASDSLFLREFLLIPVDEKSVFYPYPRPIKANIIEEEDNSIDLNPNSNPNMNGIEYDDPLHCISSSSISSTSVSSSSATSTENCSSISTTLVTRPYSIAGELQVPTHEVTNDCNKQSKSMDSVAASVTADDDSRRSINEFLNKIDKTISQSREYVEKVISGSQSDHNLFAYIDTGTYNCHRQYSTTNDFRKNNDSNNNNNCNNITNYTQQHIRQSSTGSSNSDTMQLLNTTQLRRVQNSLKRLEQQQDEFFEL